MADGYVRAVMSFFVHLYERGWMYRDNRIINWCTDCRKSISELEVEHIDVNDALTYARYPLADGGGSRPGLPRFRRGCEPEGGPRNT